MAIQGIAPVVSPILGGVLVDLIGWRGILGVVAAFQGLLVLVVIFWTPETLPADKRHMGGLVYLAKGTKVLAQDSTFVRLILIVDIAFMVLRVTKLTGPVASVALTVITVIMVILHVIAIGTCISNLPALPGFSGETLNRASDQA